MEQKKQRVLVVDDESKILEVVQSYLESKGFMVDTAADATSGLSLFEKEDYALILLDLMLPDMRGEDVCTTIRKKSRIPIIMLTAKVEEEDLLQGLNIGADDYITKPFSLKTLHARIEAVLRRSGEQEKPLYNETSFGEGDLSIDFNSLTVRKKGAEAELTPNEFGLLSTFVRYPNKVFTREELIEITFGYDYEGYSRTIDSHIKNLRKKIEDDSRHPVYVKTVHGIGYKFGGI